jgi:glycosyltransferase involved in cell wall biosynthesis
MKLIMYYARIKKIPFIFWSKKPGVKYSELPIFNSIILRTLFRKIALYPIRWAVDIWGIGERAKTYFSNYFKKDCRNIPYFFNQDNFINIKSNYKIDCIKFLFVGKFNYRKGVDILISAIINLLKQRNDFVANFVGDGPFKKDVINLANKYPNNVKYLGFKEIDEIPSVMAENDVLICPSRYDGWGMVVVEAMAAGMPVISSKNTTSAIDLINNFNNGILLQCINAKAIGESIKYFINNYTLIKSMGTNARVSSYYYSDLNGAKKIVDFINRLVY